MLLADCVGASESTSWSFAAYAIATRSRASRKLSFLAFDYDDGVKNARAALHAQLSARSPKYR